jgi:CubicO group peptidase (beta-lactamase class C family)
MLNTRSDSWLDCCPLVLVAAMFLAIPAAVHADDTAPPLRERLQTIMSDAHAKGDFDGAVLVAVDGEIAYQGAFGLADAEWNVPNTVDTHFGIASLTKSFAAHLVLALVDRKQVSLDDSLSTHLPEFTGRRIGGITIRHLLSHTAGIGDHLQFVDEEIPADVLKRWQGFAGASIPMFKEFAPYAKLIEKPGERFTYSNDGYVLLGLIVEAVTKESFEQNLHDVLLQPAQMRDSGINHHKNLLQRRARPYRREEGRIYNAPWDDTGTHFSAGGMYSTVRDLFLWDRALRSSSVLSKQAQAQMVTASSSEAWDVFGFRQYGLGWWLRRHEQLGLLAMHPGASPQYSAVLVRGIERDLVIVALSNVSSVPAMSRYVPALVEAIARGSSDRTPGLRRLPSERP